MTPLQILIGLGFSYLAFLLLMNEDCEKAPAPPEVEHDFSAIIDQRFLNAG